MISAAEMAAHTASTKAFIAADVEVIVFQHEGETVRTATGGTRTNPGTRSAPQQVRMIPQSDKIPVAADTAGTREQPEYIVLGMPDTDFRKGDKFDWRGQVWKISQLHDKPEYARKGDVILHDG